MQNPPPVPAGASTVTKALFTLGAILALIAATTFPTGYSVQIGEWAGALSALSFGVGLVIHAVWDHSP